MADRYEQWFQKVDTDGSGSLTYSELRDFLINEKGYAEDKVRSIFDYVDASSDGDGKITLEEYKSCMTKTSPQTHSESALRMVCKSFDKDGSGTINKAELKAVYAELGSNLSESDVERVMKMVDADGDGTIDYNELCMKVFGQSCD